jgi:PadR family transcriptional regulator, regulatory protein AphA
MNYSVIQKNGRSYLDFTAMDRPIASEQDVLDHLVGVCWEEDIFFAMLTENCFEEGFYRLRTGIAGGILQKLLNYRIKTALIITDTRLIRGKFEDFVLEAKKGTHFRVFSNKEEAEVWLLNA